MQVCPQLLRSTLSDLAVYFATCHVLRVSCNNAVTVHLPVKLKEKGTRLPAVKQITFLYEGASAAEAVQERGGQQLASCVMQISKHVCSHAKEWRCVYMTAVVEPHSGGASH